MAYLGQPSDALTSAFGDLLVAQPTGETQLQFPYNLNPEIVSVSTASSGTVISQPPFAVISTGVSPTGSASFQSKDNSHYRGGEGVSVLFTAIFTDGTAGSQQYVGLGNAQNGFFFGFNGSSFGILYRQTVYGATVTQTTVNNTWIPQASWNGDPLNGTGASGMILDPTKGNVYKIEMQWLGFGTLNFFIENPNLGSFTFVHEIFYPNLNTNTSVSNPSLPLSANVVNSTNTKNMVVKVPSMAMFIEGKVFQNDIIYSIADTSNQDPATLSNLLAITNVNTFNNIINAKVVVLSSISIRVNQNGGGGRPTRFSLVMNPTNVFTFVNLSAGLSCVQYDNTSTASLTGGRIVMSFYLADGSQDNLDLTPYNIYINPRDVLSVGIQRVVNNGQRACSCNLNWIERF